jgi:hypothetical protein
LKRFEEGANSVRIPRDETNIKTDLWKAGYKYERCKKLTQDWVYCWRFVSEMLNLLVLLE